VEKSNASRAPTKAGQGRPTWKRLRSAAFSALALLAPTAEVTAQQRPAVFSPTAADAVQTPAWTAVPGNAAQLSVGGDGTVFALDQDGGVWLRRPGLKVPWLALPGAFRRVAAATEKSAWAIDDKGDPYFYNGTWWRPMFDRYPVKSLDIAVSPGGATYVVTAAGRLARLDPRGGVSEIPDAPASLKRVGVDDLDRPWVIGAEGGLHRFDGLRWVALKTPPATDLAVGNGGAWMIAADGQLVALGADGATPHPMSARAASVASAPGGLPWIATADGRIYANDANTGARKAASRAQREQVFTQLINWRRINGSARQLAISAKGAILALGQDGELWQWKGRNNWSRLPGSFARVALDGDNTPWAIDDNGRILRYQGSYWNELPGVARDIAIGADGSLWIIQADGALASWTARTREWRTLPAPTPPRRIAVAPDGQPWMVDSEGAVRRYDGGQWLSLPAIGAVDIGIGPEGTVIVIGPDKRLWRWDAAGKRWDGINGEAAAVAVGPRGRPWIATSEARIFASAFFDDLSESQVNATAVATANGSKVGAGGTAPAAAGAPKGRADEALAFQKLTGAARDIAIGAEGSVFIVSFDGALARWSNARNAFVAFPGQFARIAVAPDGKPWGVTQRGEVFRHDGGDWRLVYNIAATDIAAGYDGTVMVVGPQNVLHKYLPAENRFERLAAPNDNQPPPTGVRLALEPGGVPWVIQADGFVARCDKLVCQRLPIQARDIDVGPEGSVFIIDNDRVLRRWNPRSQDFERLSTPAGPLALAAVGPLGKPWVVTQGNDIWSSAFFPRDESRDINTSATTSVAAPPGSPPVFTFTTSLSFDQINWASGPMTPMAFAIGASGKVVVLDQTLQVLVYDAAAKRFVTTAIPHPTGGGVSGLAIGPGDTLWAWVNPIPNMQNGLIRVFRNNAWQTIGGLSAMGQADGGLGNIDVAATPGGEVYAISPDSKLFRYNPASNQFVPNGTQFAGTPMALAAEPGGALWVVSNFSRVYQFSGGGFVERKPSNSSGMVCSGVGPGCIRAGAGGAVFTLDSITNRPLRWNAGSKQWDNISVSPASIGFLTGVEVAPDGRLWLLDASGKVYRAR
jgi:hypothetical protein